MFLVVFIFVTSKSNVYFFVNPKNRLLLKKTFVHLAQTIDPCRYVFRLFVKVNNYIRWFGDKLLCIRIKPVAGDAVNSAAFFKNGRNRFFFEPVPFILAYLATTRFGQTEIKVCFHHTACSAGTQQQQVETDKQQELSISYCNPHHLLWFGYPVDEVTKQ